MTQALERPAYTHNLSSSLDTLPLLETTDGSEVGQRLNSAANALNQEAQELKLKQDDDLYIIGDLGGAYMAVGRDADGNTTLHVINGGDKFFYHAETSYDGQKSTHYRVRREIGGITQDAMFSGGDELDTSTTGIARDLAAAVVEVADAQYEHGPLSHDALADIVTPLFTPENHTRKRSKKWFGGATLRQLFVRRPAAA